jgi:hypothetical protein
LGGNAASRPDLDVIAAALGEVFGLDRQGLAVDPRRVICGQGIGKFGNIGQRLGAGGDAQPLVNVDCVIRSVQPVGLGQVVDADVVFIGDSAEGITGMNAVARLAVAGLRFDPWSGGSKQHSQQGKAEHAE